MNFVSFFSVLDFFKELPQFIVKVGPVLSNLYGSDWEKRLQVMMTWRVNLMFCSYCCFYWLSLS